PFFLVFQSGPIYIGIVDGNNGCVVADFHKFGRQPAGIIAYPVFSRLDTSAYEKYLHDYLGTFFRMYSTTAPDVRSQLRSLTVSWARAPMFSIRSGLSWQSAIREDKASKSP